MQLPRQTCDYVINGTVVLFSHDDIRNLAHTMNDILNVWQLLWLHKLAANTRDLTFLNIDSFALGYNFNDRIDSEFFAAYKNTFQAVLSGKEFMSQRTSNQHTNVCIQRVVMQSQPPTLYTWDSWSFDNDCTFRGPSSLFQRFNLHVRKNLGLLTSSGDTNADTQEKLNVLLIFRKKAPNNWGNERTMRNALVRFARIVLMEVLYPSKLCCLQNAEAVERSLTEYLKDKYPAAKLRTVYFEDLTFSQQLKQISSTSIMIGNTCWHCR
jgi:hypothetical protein